jgi:[acyl-carrier-protein] S-malonyltransferase
MFVIAAPGQGSQKPGFLEPWLELPGARDSLGALSDRIGVDLIAHGTTSDQETITDTAVAQPLIVAAGILTGRALLKTLGDTVLLEFAGHSVGEFTAAALAGVMSDDDAVAVVAERGRAMASASAQTPTGMSAVIGGELADIESAVESSGIYAANFNGGGQVVVAGDMNALASFGGNPPAGTRVIPLSVAGAFHTPYMASAVEAVRAVASTVTASDPRYPLFTNRDGSVVTSGATYVDYLVDQVARPVRWDACMASFHARDIQGMMELAPSGALTGLAKRALKGVPTVAVNTPEDLDKAREMVASQ